MPEIIRRVAVTACVAVACLVLLPIAVSNAQEVSGSADFRTAERLEDGTYRDSVTTGEKVFYSVLYRNNIPYEISVTPVDDLGEGETLRVEFIGPTLNVLTSGTSDDGPLTGSASYDAGGTNQWYIAVALDTETSRGILREFELSISGMVDGRLIDCSATADCDADEELADAQESLDEAIARRDGGGPTAEEVESEITSTEERIDDLTEQISAADPGTEVPVLPLVLLGLIAVGLVAAAVWSRRTPATSATPPPEQAPPDNLPPPPTGQMPPQPPGDVAPPPPPDQSAPPTSGDTEEPGV